MVLEGYLGRYDLAWKINWSKVIHLPVYYTTEYLNFISTQCDGCANFVQ